MEIKCDVCGKTGFKSKAGLAGHKKIAHGADTRITYPDEIAKRLEAIEKNQLAVVDTLDKFVRAADKNFDSITGWIETATGHLIKAHK